MAKKSKKLPLHIKTLQEYLDEFKIDKYELSKKCELTPKMINDIIHYGTTLLQNNSIN